MVASLVLAARRCCDGRDPVADRPRGRRRSRPAIATALGAARSLAVVVAAAGAARAVGLPPADGGRVSLGVEVDLRDRLYAHLQELELGFFDGQQTGQLMSRATVDLQSVRFFLGYGLVFIMQCALTILLARRDVRHRPRAGALALAPVPFVVFVAAALRAPLAAGAPGGPAADRRADRRRRGERLRACGWSRPSRPRSASWRASGVGRRVFDQSMIATRLRAFYNPFIGFLPPLGLAVDPARRRAAGDRRRAVARRLHGLLHVPADADRADAHARHGARHGPARDRVRARASSSCSTARREMTAPGGGRCPPGGRVELRGVTFAYEERGAPALRDVDLVVEAGARPSRSSARPASGKTSLVRLLPRLYDVTAGAVLIDGADVRDCRPASAAARDRRRHRRPVPVLGHGAREHRLRAGRRRRARRSSARRERAQPARVHRRAARRLRHA